MQILHFVGYDDESNLQKTHWKQTIGGEQIGHPLQIATVVEMVDAPINMEKTTVVNRDSGFGGILTPSWFLWFTKISNLISLVFSRKLKWK